MTIRNRIRLIAFGIATTVAILGCAFSRHVQELGLDFWNVDRYQTELLEAEARSERLEVARSDAQTRSTLKLDIAHKIISDQIPFVQAIEQFLVLNKTNQDVSTLVKMNFPAPTLEESTALQVITYVQVRLKDYPENEKKQIISRLSCERQALHDKLPLLR